MGKLTNEAMLALMVYQCSTGKSHYIYNNTVFQAKQSSLFSINNRTTNYW